MKGSPPQVRKIIRHFVRGAYHLVSATALLALMVGASVLYDYGVGPAPPTNPLFEPSQWHPALQWGAGMFLGGLGVFLALAELAPWIRRWGRS